MNENTVELAVLDWFQSLGYEPIYGPTLAPDQPGAERQDYAQVVLTRRLRDAMLSTLLSGEIELPAPEAITAEVSDTMVETAR